MVQRRAAVLPALIAAMVTLTTCGGGGSIHSPPPPPSPPPSPPGPNAPPAFTSPLAAAIRENAIGVAYRPVATDPEGDSLTYTFAGPDAARFTMKPMTSEVRFIEQPNFEAPADAGANNVYDLTFSVSDGINTVSQNVAITVTDVAPGFHVRRIATGLSSPTFVTGLPDGTGRIVVVERAGRIRVMNPATGMLATSDLLNLSGQIDTSGEKGLLAVAFSPNFLVDRTFYIHMNPLNANVTEIRQYRTLLTAYDQADAATANVILTVQQPPGTSFTNHKGGTLIFDAADRLLIGLGDGGGAGDPNNNAQNDNVLLGKLLRIDPTTDAFPTDDTRDYSIPAENPFASGGGSPEIWLKGLRNPFRSSIDPVTNDLFIGDVGQNTVEEVDRIPRFSSGLLNFGWNRREGSQPFNGGLNDPTFIPPVAEYFHGLGTFQGQSITGGSVYRGPVEDLQGLYIFGDFISDHIWSVPISSLIPGSTLPASSFALRDTSFAPTVGTIDQVVAFSTDVDGNLYIVDLGGEVFVIEP